MKTRRTLFLQRTAWISGMLAICIFLMAASKMVKVARESQGRSGPGSYYELKVIIPAGKSLELLEIKKSWYKVRYSGQEVWISENSVVTQTGSASRAGEPLAMDNAPLKASSAAVSAAIKGFWTRFTRVDRTKLAELPVDGCEVPPAKYEAFEQERSRTVSRDALLDRWSIRNPKRPGRVPFVKEQSIGYSIASSVADAPLIKSGQAVDYVNSVGRYLAEGTERNDIPFRFYILDTDRVNAISCPGGYVVLTRELLEMVSDEAELAALLAHEMAHVIAGHGMKEVIDDRIRIQADDAFAALDEEMKNDPAEEEELIGITNRALSIAKAPKLDEYEFEADRMALLYMARSGYDLNGLSRLLVKLQEKQGNNIDIFDLNYRNHPDFEKRSRLSGAEIRNYRKYEGQAFSQYFRKNMMF